MKWMIFVLASLSSVAVYAQTPYPHPVSQLNDVLNTRDGFTARVTTATFLTARRIPNTNDFFVHWDKSLDNVVSDATMDRCIDKALGQLKSAESMLGVASATQAKKLEKQNQLFGVEIQLKDMRKLSKDERLDYDNKGSVFNDPYSGTPNEPHIRAVLTSDASGKIMCNTASAQQIYDYYKKHVTAGLSAQVSGQPAANSR